MTTFITRYDTSGDGVRLAVKDLIDMAGEPTTAGCRAVADAATPAARDAACMAGARAAGARIVGRTNLHELAFGVTGINEWYGTPVNPLDPSLVPGGSSSGSAVAVAVGDADVAYGSDTGGSVRIPSACCGTAGLKTTWGRISLDGVWPLAPSFDTVGPMARDVAGLVTGMQLLEPGFTAAPARAIRVGRLRVETDPVIDEAIDRALAATEWDVVEIDMPGWGPANHATGVLLVAEAWASNAALMESAPDKVSRIVGERLLVGKAVDANAVASANETRADWTRQVREMFERVDLIATPTLTVFPPRIAEGDVLLTTRCTLPINLAGVPSVALPVPSSGALPASLQLVGPPNSEEWLLTSALVAEDAVN